MDFVPLLIFTGGVLILGMGVGILIGNQNTKAQYKKLRQPKLAPPGWVFGPVWTILYIMIGISGYLVYSEIGFKHKLPWVVYFVQLFLNYIWSPIFFLLRRYKWAFYEIVLLDTFVVWNIFEFYSYSTWAAFLLVPYALWCFFASYIAFSIWRLNGDYYSQENETIKVDGKQQY